MKHQIMESGPDLERALAELKASGIKVIDWQRVGRRIVFKVMAPKPQSLQEFIDVQDAIDEGQKGESNAVHEVSAK